MIRGVRSLSVADWLTLVESLVLAVGIETALRVASFSCVLRSLGAAPGRNASGPVTANPASGELYARLRRFVAVAYRILPLPLTCLRESLVLCALLNRRGVGARLCLGVRKDGSSIAAHAWVECDGVETVAAPFRELHMAARRAA